MKNNIKIIYDKMNRYPKDFVNGEENSRFMSLSNYIYDDIFCWADIFFEIMDAELSEEYIIELTGSTPFYHRTACFKTPYSRHMGICFASGIPPSP